ncbi:hypothetical protein RJD24_14800 [Bacillaceae bacterium IKA-2]|nr:hypothetical protein RJD24_14800 [Bacillaceae bacterium IKA-2]
MTEPSDFDCILNNKELADPASKIFETVFYDETILSNLVFSNAEIISLLLDCNNFLADFSINKILDLSESINRFIETIYMKEWLTLKKLEISSDLKFLKQNHSMTEEIRLTIENKFLMNDDYPDSIVKLEHVLIEFMNSVEIYASKEEYQTNYAKKLFNLIKNQVEIGLSQLIQLQALIVRKRKLFNNLIIKNYEVSATSYAHHQDDQANQSEQQRNEFKPFPKVKLPLEKVIHNIGIYYLKNQGSYLPKIFVKEFPLIKPWLNENIF